MHATHNPDGTHAEPVTRHGDARPETGTIGTCEICGTGDTPVQLIEHPNAVRPFVVCADATACMSHFHDQPIPVVLTTGPVTQGNPARILRSAADYLHRHGWIQGAYYDATAGVFTPPACLVGALGVVCYGGPVDAPALNDKDPGWDDFVAAQDYLDAYLCRVHPYDIDAYSYNDTPGRTRDQVLAMLHDAAAGWERAHTHADYPHTPGTLYDCPACEGSCFCTDGFQCVHCALAAEQADGATTLGGGA